MGNFDIALLQEFALRLVGALALAFIGFKVADKLGKIGAKMLDKGNLDVSLKKFLASMIAPVLKVLVIIMAMGVAGADVSAFVAVIGGASFAVGLAFQGTLANFAGGVLLLVVRPFTVGDFVEAGGETGTVEAISIIYTKLLTVDNKLINVPNGSLANAVIINYTREDKRRVDLVFGAAYDAPVEKVKAAIVSVLEAHDKVLKEPAYFVRLGNQGASSLDYTVRAWVKTADYWDVHFDLIEQVTAKFNAENIGIPYNTIDVNINNNN